MSVAFGSEEFQREVVTAALAKLFTWKIEVEVIDDDIFTQKATLFLNNWKMTEFTGPGATGMAHILSLQATPWSVTAIGQMKEYSCQKTTTRRYTDGRSAKVFSRLGANADFLLHWQIAF